MAGMMGEGTAHDQTRAERSASRASESRSLAPSEMVGPLATRHASSRGEQQAACYSRQISRVNHLYIPNLQSLVACRSPLAVDSDACIAAEGVQRVCTSAGRE
jgi:hypothetical protein